MTDLIVSEAFTKIIKALMKNNNDRKSTIHGFTLKELQVIKENTVNQFREYL